MSPSYGQARLTLAAATVYARTHARHDPSRQCHPAARISIHDCSAPLVAHIHAARPVRMFLAPVSMALEHYHRTRVSQSGHYMHDTLLAAA